MKNNFGIFSGQGCDLFYDGLIFLSIVDTSLSSINGVLVNGDLYGVVVLMGFGVVLLRDLIISWVGGQFGVSLSFSGFK